MQRNIVERIHGFNQGRDPERLKLKYQKMTGDSFIFFRGTCHLFYEDWLCDPTLDSAPPTWICGDLHLENFGSFKGDDRQVYFGMNDFDEAALAPCTWELARLLTSIFVGSRTLGVSTAEAKHLCYYYLKAYTSELATGKPRWVHLNTAKGMVKDLLLELKERKRKDFLNRRTTISKNGNRRLAILPGKTTPISLEERSQIVNFMEKLAASEDNPDFYNLLDVTGRLAGTGSLGVRRYLLLVEGKESPDRNYLLDFKQMHPSALQPYLRLPQPAWDNEAVRVATTQTRMQVVPPALLHAVIMDNEPFLLRELQPTQDKLSLVDSQGKLGRLEKVVKTMGQITAWSQLRSSGRQGSATADDLIAFAETSDWHDLLVNYAEVYSVQVEADYQEFCKDVGKL